MINSGLLIIFGVAGLLAVIAIFVLVLFKKEVKGLPADKFAQLWAKINKMSNSNEIILQRQAVIEADKLLDAVLKSKVHGQNLGSRLIAAQELIDDRQIYSGLWEAHKLRNRLVHEVNENIGSGQCQRAIKDFKKGFDTLGY